MVVRGGRGTGCALCQLIGSLGKLAVAVRGLRRIKLGDFLLESHIIRLRGGNIARPQILAELLEILLELPNLIEHTTWNVGSRQSRPSYGRSAPLRSLSGTSLQNLSRLKPKSAPD